MLTLAKKTDREPRCGTFSLSASWLSTLSAQQGRKEQRDREGCLVPPAASWRASLPEYLFAKFGKMTERSCLLSFFKTAENESSKVCEKVVRTLDRLSNDKQSRYFKCADNHGIFVRMDQNQVPTALACHEHHPARANSRFWNTRADRSRRPVNEALDAAAKHSFRFHRPNYHFRPSSKTSDNLIAAGTRKRRH